MYICDGVLGRITHLAPDIPLYRVHYPEEKKTKRRKLGLKERGKRKHEKVKGEGDNGDDEGAKGERTRMIKKTSRWLIREMGLSNE